MNTALQEYYQKALHTVQQVTGIDDVLHTNKEEAVDARTILIYVLALKGISDNEIAQLTGLSRQGVNKLKNNYKFRKSRWSFVSNLQQTSNELATNSF